MNGPLYPNMIRKTLRSLEPVFCFSRCFRNLHICSALLGKTKLTSQEISAILRVNEFTKDINNRDSAVKFYDSNQLASNSPIEDTRSEGQCTHSQSLLLGVFDGHAGPYCAQVVAKRIFDYVCAGLIPQDKLRQYHDAFIRGEKVTLVERFNEYYDLAPELESLYRKSFIDYLEKLTSNEENKLDVAKILEQAVICLDEDISSAALKEESQFTSLKAVNVAVSGAVGCFVLINGINLHVTNVGDCRVVLGRLARNNSMIAKELSQDHNVENVSEVHRIRQEHPPDERDFVIWNRRLLGQLAPLRAFGDVRFKWSKNDLECKVVPVFGKWAIAPMYKTPPYLTARPEITRHQLSSRDKFLIIASDGFWDEVTPSEAVHLVANHICGKKVLDPFQLQNPDIKLKAVNRLLAQRKKFFNIKPVDRNSATHLIRKAIGGGSSDEERISRMLTFSQDEVRYHRDDITVTVVYFNSEYLRLHSSSS